MSSDLMDQLSYTELTDFQLCNELTSVKQRIIDRMKENEILSCINKDMHKYCNIFQCCGRAGASNSIACGHMLGWSVPRSKHIGNFC